MRLLIMVLAFWSAAGWAYHHENDYSEERLLSIDADGVMTLEIDAGSGSLEILGTDGAGGIVVQAVVRVDTDDEKKARKLIAERLELSLDQNGDRAQLTSKFKDSLRFWGANGSVDLVIQVPTNTRLIIDDRSGSIVIQGVRGDLEIEDGSGSVRLAEVGSVRLDDGSGSINVDDAAGDVLIDDGSGSVTIRSVDGSVTIRDGSGGITVENVSGDLIIEEDGSGSVRSANVQGAVIRNDQ